MVYLFLAEGFEEIEALATVDILRRADVEVETVSITDSNKVMGAHKIEVTADKKFEEISDDADMYILPGGMPGTLNLGEFQPLCDLLKKANDEEKYIAAICAAPSIFGELGLLRGKKASCYPGFEEKLLGAEVLRHPVVVSGNIITSRGAGTAHTFALKLVSLLKNDMTSESLKKGMLYE